MHGSGGSSSQIEMWGLFLVVNRRVCEGFYWDQLTVE